MKTGYKTSEFWIAILVSGFGILGATGVIQFEPQSDIENAVRTLVEAAMVVAASVSYILARTELKKRK